MLLRVSLAYLRCWWRCSSRESCALWNREPGSERYDCGSSASEDGDVNVAMGAGIEKIRIGRNETRRLVSVGEVLIQAPHTFCGLAQSRAQTTARHSAGFPARSNFLASTRLAPAVIIYLGQRSSPHSHIRRHRRATTESQPLWSSSLYLPTR